MTAKPTLTEEERRLLVYLKEPPAEPGKMPEVVDKCRQHLQVILSVSDNIVTEWLANNAVAKHDALKISAHVHAINLLLTDAALRAQPAPSDAEVAEISSWYYQCLRTKPNLTEYEGVWSFLGVLIRKLAAMTAERDASRTHAVNLTKAYAVEGTQLMLRAEAAERALAEAKVRTAEPIPVNAPTCGHGKLFLEYCPECEAARRWDQSTEPQQPAARGHNDQKQ